MNSTEKEVSYQAHNTYSTLNNLSSKTKHIWFVCHGLGFLSRYFIQYFKHLNPEENFIIAPQAQAKHYLNGKFKHVGASWLTKENTAFEVENVLNYLDSVYAAEVVTKNPHFIVLGFSQGVSVATRWVAKRKITCSKLVLYAGKVPHEFTSNDFEQVNSVTMIVGDQDEYVTPEIVNAEKEYLNTLFKKRIEYINFTGKHEVKHEIINSICS